MFWEEKMDKAGEVPVKTDKLFWNGEYKAWVDGQDPEIVVSGGSNPGAAMQRFCRKTTVLVSASFKKKLKNNRNLGEYFPTNPFY